VDDRAAQLVHARLEGHARARRSLFKNHRQGAVGQRLVGLIALKALLDDPRALDHVLDLFAREIGKL